MSFTPGREAPSWQVKLQRQRPGLNAEEGQESLRQDLLGRVIFGGNCFRQHSPQTPGQET